MDEPLYVKVENYLMGLIENMKPGDMLPVHRLYLIHRQISVSYLPVNEIQAMDWQNIDFSSASLYKSLEDSGVVLATGEEDLEVDIASSLDAILLNVDIGFPIFVTNP